MPGLKWNWLMLNREVLCLLQCKEASYVYHWILSHYCPHISLIPLRISWRCHPPNISSFSLFTIVMKESLHSCASQHTVDEEYEYFWAYGYLFVCLLIRWRLSSAFFRGALMWANAPSMSKRSSPNSRQSVNWGIDRMKRTNQFFMGIHLRILRLLDHDCLGEMIHPSDDFQKTHSRLIVSGSLCAVVSR